MPRDLFFLTLRDYVSENELKQKVDNALRSHPDKRYSSMDLKQIAKDEKEKLLTAGIPSQKEACEKCNSSYDINGIWPYKLCQKCALNEKYKWENIWLSELGYDEEFAGIIPTPPIDTKKYRIDATFNTESSGRGKTSMTQEPAARIQSHADRNETNQDFKARAQSAAAKNKTIYMEDSGRPFISVRRLVKIASSSNCGEKSKFLTCAEKFKNLTMFKKYTHETYSTSKLYDKIVAYFFGWKILLRI